MHSGCSNTIFAYDNFMVCIRIQLKSNMEQTPILYQGYARIVPYWTGLNVSVVRKMGLDITIKQRKEKENYYEQRQNDFKGQHNDRT